MKRLSGVVSAAVRNDERVRRRIVDDFCHRAGIGRVGADVLGKAHTALCILETGAQQVVYGLVFAKILLEGRGKVGVAVQGDIILAREFLAVRKELGRTKPICLMDVATLAVRELKARGRLDDAAKVLADIKMDIAERKTTAIGDNTMISSLIGLGYRLCSGTKKFYAEDTCTGCGLCARNCPMQVIVMKDKRPVWTEEKCCKCSTCINRCPVKAIQYGKATKKRNRYVNPLV